MTTRLLTLGATLALATSLATGTSAVATDDHGGRHHHGGHHHSGHGTDDRTGTSHRLEARLRPSGDPDGSGEAHLTLSRARHRVCAQVEWHRIGTPDAAHIHRASDGQIVVDLTGSVTGGAHCAQGVSGRLIGRLLAHPRSYYFNVHNAAHPSGAIQGTLHH